MPVEVRWLDKDRRIILYEFWDQYTIPEFIEAMEKALSLSAEVPEKTYTIADFTRSPRLPSGSISAYPTIASKVSEGKSTLNILVGTTRFVATLTGIFSRVYHKLEYADTREEALAIIKEHQATES